MQTTNLNDSTFVNIPVTVETLGARVIKGRDWDWGDQNGGTEGTIISRLEGTTSNWVRVRWDNDNENSYRIGHDNKYDLYYAKSHSIPEKWYVACKDLDTDTPELKEWRDLGWSGAGYITSDKRWSYSTKEYTEISYQEFLEKVYRPWKGLESTSRPYSISRELLNKYYGAATAPQREYINDNFKVDGTTTVQGIIGLYDIACKTWKSTIKQNHPECFPVTKTAIELAVEKAGKPSYDMCEVKIEGNLILVKLPNANTEWSFAAFEWVMKFCKENPQAYPIHKNTNNNTDYLYIQWN